MEKLELAAADVSKMQVELVELQPQLIVACKDVDDMVIVIEKESIEVEKVATVVAKDEAVANEQASAAKAIADDCDKDLSRALPILNAALAALDTLTAQVCKQTTNHHFDVKEQENLERAIQVVIFLFLKFLFHF